MLLGSAARMAQKNPAAHGGATGRPPGGRLRAKQHRLPRHRLAGRGSCGSQSVPGTMLNDAIGTQCRLGFLTVDWRRILNHPRHAPAPNPPALHRHNLEGGQLFDADPGEQFGGLESAGRGQHGMLPARGKCRYAFWGSLENRSPRRSDFLARSPIFWHEKSPIDKLGCMRNPFDARRQCRLLVPPRRVGMESVDGLAGWLWRTRPTSGLGCSTPASIFLWTWPSRPYNAAEPCGEAGADERVEFGREGEIGVRPKTRSRAGTPDAGALLFQAFLLSGWGYRVTPGISPTLL